MDSKCLKANAGVLNREMDWLGRVIQARFDLFFRQETEYSDIYHVQAPVIADDGSGYGEIVRKHGIDFDERVILALALAPHIKPSLLDLFLIVNKDFDRKYTEFGGIINQNHGRFIPTGETAAFIIGGDDLEMRFKLHTTFSKDHFFRKFKVLELAEPQPHGFLLTAGITITKEYLYYFTNGNSFKPEFSTNFPAKLITTDLDWSDLVLEESLITEVNEIKEWVESEYLLKDGGERNDIQPGYTALFYGPRGTGKTVTACLLGKSLGRDVYRVNLSVIISKYIGETERQLENVFDYAELNNSILFFDEFDAQLSRHTNTGDSVMEQSTPGVSYLLQRIKDFPGVVILSTHQDIKLDEAHLHHFKSKTYFPMPGYEQRKLLWKQIFSTLASFEESFFDELAQNQEVTAGFIQNVGRYCMIKAAKRGDKNILKRDINEGVLRELGRGSK